MERIRNIDLILLALIFVALAAWTFLLPPIWNHGEAREGLVVQDIVRNHNWILPFRNGQVPSKPPLFHWIAGSLGSLFGLSDFIVRFPSALAAEVMAVATFLLGSAIGGRKTAWLAVGALLGMYEFWVAGTVARVDMVFAACVTVSIAGFFFWHRSGGHAARAVCYFAAAAAVLAKGPAGGVLPALAIVPFLVVEKRPGLIWKLWSWPLIAAALLIDVSWYAIAYQIGGSRFFAVQILRENVDRIFGTHGFSNRNAGVAIAVWLATRIFPWNLAIVWSLVERLRGKREDSDGRFLHLWWIAISAVFFLATGKRAVYLLPIYPAVALLAARALAAVSESGGETAEHLHALRARLVRLVRSPARLAVAIAVVDLALILPNPTVWRHWVADKRILSFVAEVSAAAPRNGPLFADADLHNTDLIVMAYRLQRNILRKPIACAALNDYFLVPADSSDLAGTAMKIVASSESNRMALVRVLATQGKTCPGEKANSRKDDQADSD
jgi:4-amino-4-deoxy-L-arabinose transferase-like glycosyltransferase